MNSLFYIGLGAVAMWAYRKIKGEGVSGRRITGPGALKAPALPIRRWKKVSLRDGTTELVAVPHAFGNRHHVGVLCYRATPHGNYVTHRGKDATERMFRAAITENDLKVSR